MEAPGYVGLGQRQAAKLNEMISRAGSAELPPGFVFIFASDSRDRPVAVHHRVVLRPFMRSANAKPGSVFDRSFEEIEQVLIGERRRRHVEHR